MLWKLNLTQMHFISSVNVYCVQRMRSWDACMDPCDKCCTLCFRGSGSLQTSSGLRSSYNRVIISGDYENRSQKSPIGEHSYDQAWQQFNDFPQALMLHEPRRNESFITMSHFGGKSLKLSLRACCVLWASSGETPPRVWTQTLTSCPPAVL